MTSRAVLDAQLARILADALVRELRAEDAGTEQEATGIINADDLNVMYVVSDKNTEEVQQAGVPAPPAAG